MAEYFPTAASAHGAIERGPDTRPARDGWTTLVSLTEHIGRSLVTDGSIVLISGGPKRRAFRDAELCEIHDADLKWFDYVLAFGAASWSRDQGQW